MNRKIVKTPHRGDIGWLTLDPQAGNEQAKRRLVLVLSANKFNVLGLAVIAPITSTDPRHGFHLPIPNGMKIQGVIMCEQIKSLDWRAREFDFFEIAPLSLITQVRQIVKQII